MPRPADPNAHDALLKAARAEFARAGIDRARIEDICKRAGLSKGAFYLHFDSKADAFREVLQRFIGVLEELAERRREAEERFACAGGTLTDEDVTRSSDRFREALRVECDCDVELLEALWRNRELLAILNGSGGTEYLPLIEAFRERMGAQIAGNATAKQAAGGLRTDIDVRALSDIIVGAYESFGRRMVAMRDKPDLRAWARTLQIMICEGALKGAESAEPGAPPLLKVADRSVTNRR